MERYEKYKTSRVMCLPEIPVHWEMSKAKYYFQYTTGFTPLTGVAEFYNGDITWVTIADMNQKVVFDSATKLSQTAIDKYNPDLTLKDSLLYSFKLSVGKVAYAGKDLYTNEAIISILPNKTYDLRYFYYTLPEQLLQNAGENIYGAKMLNQELIRNATICFPPKEEQTAIADFLDEKTAQIDILIEKKQKLIDLLKEKRVAIINHAVTKGINPKTKLKPSGIEWLGDIPEHWNVKKIGYLASVTKLTGFEYTNKWNTNELGEIIALRGYNVGNGFLDLRSVERISIDLSNTLLRSKLFKNDIVYPCTGTIGNACLIDQDNTYHINQNIAKLTPYQIVNPKYLLFALLSYGVKSQIHFNNSSQMQPVILISELRQIKIAIPTDIQEQIEVVNKMEKEIGKLDLVINKIEKEMELLQEYRAALISEVVTGKIKVM